MGAVYKGLDQTLGRYVAIKVVRKALGEDAESLERFLREARAAAALNHRNVVQVYSCGQEKGQPYIVMELVSGGRLDEMMAAGKPLDETRIMEIGVDVAGAAVQALADVLLVEPFRAAVEVARVLAVVADLADVLGAAHRRARNHVHRRPLVAVTLETGEAFTGVLPVDGLDRRVGAR